MRLPEGFNYDFLYKGADSPISPDECEEVRLLYSVDANAAWRVDVCSVAHEMIAGRIRHRVDHALRVLRTHSL